MTSTANVIEVAVQKRLGDFTLDVAFEAGSGITALFGPSGSGKTTVLNLISGIVRPQRGRIACRGTVFVDTEAGVYLPKHKRRVGLVFQDAQLFPHLTVAQNIAFGRWFVPAAGRTAPVDQVIHVLGISDLMARRPARLSGGEKQRVALARALLASPRLLLMDEPLAGLDDDRQQEIFPLIERMRDEFGIPILYITHSVAEVRRLASTVVMLKNGRVQQTGPVRLVFPPDQSAVGGR